MIALNLMDKEKHYSDVVDAGVESISEFGNDHLIPHFIMCFGYWFHYEDFETFKEIFFSKMRRYGIRSAILTISDFRRNTLETKEAVKQKHNEARKLVSSQLKKANGKYTTGDRNISEDFELYNIIYISLQIQKVNPKKKPLGFSRHAGKPKQRFLE